MGDAQVAYYENQLHSLFFTLVFSTFMIVKYPRLLSLIRISVSTHLRIHMLCIHIYFWQDREGIHQEYNNRA